MITIEDSMIRMSGTVNNNTVPALLTQLNELPDQALTLNLSGVERVDSAAVSLLLTLKRLRPDSLTVTHIPANLQSLIRLYDVDELLCPQAR